MELNLYVIRKISTINSNPIYSGYSVWRAIFESKQTSINFHLGPNFHVVSYPVDSNRVSFIAAIKNKNKFKESWKEKGTIDDLLDEVPLEIIDKYKSIKDSKNIYKWGVYIRPQIEFLFKEEYYILRRCSSSNSSIHWSRWMYGFRRCLCFWLFIK